MVSHADALAENGESIKGVIGHDYLRATTLFPGSRFAGKVCFNRDKALKSGAAKIAIGSTTYTFPFPPVSSTAPETAPEIPAIGEIAYAPIEAVTPTSNPQPSTAQESAKPGVF